MAIVPPEKVGEARPLTMVNPEQLEVIKAAASDADKLSELAALLPHLKTFVFGKGMIEQDFRFPDGTIKTFNLWHSPGARTSIMFPLTRDGKVIVLRQWRPAAAYLEPEHAIITELPGGNPKPGTDPTHAEVSETELREESGYSAEDWTALLPKMAWWEPANLTPRYMPMLGIDCEKVQEPEPDETELIEVLVLPLRQWIEMIRRGEVRDAKSITVTFLALLRLGLIELKLP